MSKIEKTFLYIFVAFALIVSVIVYAMSEEAEEQEPEDPTPLVIDSHIKEGFYDYGTITFEDNGECYAGPIRLIFDGKAVRVICGDMVPSDFNKNF